MMSGRFKEVYEERTKQIKDDIEKFKQHPVFQFLDLYSLPGKIEEFNKVFKPILGDL